MSYPNTGAPEWGSSQASPWVPVNEAQFIFDAFASRSIIEDRDLTAPPGSCDNGARYLIDATATGDWTGHDGELAIAIGADASNGWYFAIVALHGNQLFVRDEDLLIEHDGAAWVTAPGGVSVLNDLTDVDAPTPTEGDVLTFDGADWVPRAGSRWKDPVRVATTGSGTLASGFENGDTIDGVALATGDRILIKNQAAPAENGIYIVEASGTPTRADDANSGAELVNAAVLVSEGAANADTLWICAANAPITVGSTALVWGQQGSSVPFASAATTSAGSSTTEAVTPDGLAGSIFGTKTVEVLLSDPNGIAVTTGDGKAFIRITSDLNGMNLVGCGAVLDTAGTGGGYLLQLRRKRAGSDVDMLSTRISIDSGENDSADASAPAVINTSNDDVATGDRIYFDRDGISTGGKGDVVWMQFQLP